MSSRDRDSLDIEFVSPDASAFGDSGGDGFVGSDLGSDAPFGDGPRSSRLTVIAGVMVVGLIAVGVIASSPWSGDDAAPTPTTEVAPGPVINVPAPSTTDLLEGVPDQPVGWVLDPPPEGFQLSSAQSIPVPFGEQLPAEVWGEPGGSPDDRWITVQMVRNDGGRSLRRNGERIDLGVRRAVVDTSDDGITTVEVGTLDGSEPLQVVVRGHTVTPDLLVELAERAAATGGLASQIGYGDDAAPPAAFIGLTRLWSGRMLPDDGGSIGPAVASTSYYDPATGRGLTIDLGIPDRSLAPYLRLFGTDIGGDTMAAVDLGLGLGLGTTPTIVGFGSDQGVANVRATWVRRDESVTFTGYGTGVDVVIEAALRAQLADGGIWIRALRQTNAGISFNEGRPSPSAYVTGTLTSGREWSGSLADTYVFVSAAITPGQATGGGSPIDIPDRPALQRFANPFMTVVAATAPWPSIATTLRVTVQGQPPVEMPLRQLNDSPIGGTIVVYDDLLPATAELLDASGAVIATG